MQITRPNLPASGNTFFKPTLRLQMAQSGPYLTSVGTKVGIIYRLGALNLRVKVVVSSHSHRLGIG